MSTKNFHWPNQFQQEETSNHVVTTVKDIVTSFVDKTNTHISSTVHQPITGVLENTVTEIPQLITVRESITTQLTDNVEITTQNILTTITDNISNTVRNIINTESTRLTEAFSPNISVIISTNSSTVTEAVDSGTMSETTIENLTLEPTTNIITETINSIINTTEDAISTITSTANEFVSNGTRTQTSDDMDKNDLTVYIILGVLLGVLVLVFLALLAFYKKYKSNHRASNNYCVTQLKEINSNSSVKTASDLNDVSVKH